MSALAEAAVAGAAVAAAAGAAAAVPAKDPSPPPRERGRRAATSRSRLRAALRAAGMARAALLGAVAAVNVGQWASEFGSVLLGTPAGRSVYAATGISLSIASGRLSFVLGLQGPCFAVDTACSASLVALHSAYRDVQKQECDVYLAAGVNLTLLQSS